MSASLLEVDRPTPLVAIVGTDAVLAAAPATPVQLAHACLRRGFTVAVPASWGDELVASETLRRLATRARGPAVMCVCPFARARLLGHGADLAPFLVSLVSPPVAVARFLRSVYGEQGVHVTYIGSCAGANDPSIDVHLTPDAFIAELAEHGIALSEQPLVFDSIVPPDRRRWCSLPGGVPNADMLAAEADGRTTVEIDRTDITTELAQHILTREHVLLDLAPGLGCSCSGAIGLVSPDRARATVMAGEPPRALGAVIDPAAIVSLDVPLRTSTDVPPGETAPAQAESDTVLERVLDGLLGGVPVPGDQPRSPEEPGTSAIILDLPQLPSLAGAITVTATIDQTSDIADSDDEPTVVIDDVHADVVIESVPIAATAPAPEFAENADSIRSSAPDTPAAQVETAVVVAESEDAALGEPSPSPTDAVLAPPPSESPTFEQEAAQAAEPLAEQPTEDVVSEAADQPESPVRRRTPAPMLRYAGSAIPRAAVANGRALPRAYVAKRRTPPAGAAIISPAVSHPDGLEPSSPRPLAAEEQPAVIESLPTPVAEALPPTPLESNPGASVVGPAAPVLAGTLDTAPVPPAAVGTPHGGKVAMAAEMAPAVPTTSASEAPMPRTGGKVPTAPASPSTTRPALLFLLVTALVALAVFVLLTLQR